MKVLGYCSQLSVFPGETVDFHVSCDEPEYWADIVKLIHGDTNPDGPGEKIEPVRTDVDGTFPGRVQLVHSGSYVIVDDHPKLRLGRSWTVQTMVCPTRLAAGEQALVTRWNDEGRSGYGLFVGADGSLLARTGDGTDVSEVSAAVPLLEGVWYLAVASRSEDGVLAVHQRPLLTATNSRFAFATSRELTTASAELTASVTPPNDPSLPTLLAAHVRSRGNTSDELVTGGHFNGKLDRPRMHSTVLDASAAEAAIENPRERDLLARWDFQREITPAGITQTRSITDTSHNRLHGRTVNVPTRGMTGYNWQAREQNFTHAPEQYGAIHFHDDDLDDARWKIDFTLAVPQDLPSGLYAARLRAGDDTDHVPFYVRARPGEEKRVCVVMPTASYMAYANDHVTLSAPLAQLMVARAPVMEQNAIVLSENREFGLSTYDTHSDGSGVAYSSRKRPILNMRPGFRHWLSPSLWQFNADLHLIDWLTEQGYDFDVITDEDLHREGVDAVSPYRVVLTGSHPEYCSDQMLDALHQYAHEGGRMMYFGGNGFYWVTAFDPEDPSVIEVRKGNGSNAWKCRPGEYHLSFTGEYGTLWRHRGRAPQRLFGVGFGSEGFDVSSYYRKTPDGLGDGPAAWMFEGISDDEQIGDFGLVGDGAAGLELDVYDATLGTPPETVIGATSQDHTDIYLEVAEELYFNVPGVSGSQSGQVRADITYFPTNMGGGVWSCSSIAYCGSLSHNNYDNNISRLTGNVLNRFLQDGPAPLGAPANS